MFGLIPFRTDKDVIGGTLAGLMSDFFNDDFLTPMRMNFDMSRFNIKADMRETDNEYLISAKLPEVNKEDISLDYRNNNLTIKARKSECSSNNENSCMKSYGEIARSFYLDNVDKESIRARFENGELQIIAPKAHKSESHNSGIYIE